MAKLPLDLKNPDMAAVREVVVQRLRDDPGWKFVDPTGVGFSQYVEMQPGEYGEFAYLAKQVCWRFLCLGIFAPGFNSSNADWPYFHLTPLGKLVVATGSWPAYDPDAYLDRLAAKLAAPDKTALSYLGEALRSFEQGNYVAGAVMLGIAAERVFLLVCQATLTALSDSREHANFARILQRFAVKPKLDWVHAKFLHVQKAPPSGFPENASLTITGIYDLLRVQRNDLGHPRDLPPQLTAEELFADLQIFPGFIESSERLCNVLAASQI